MNKTAVIFMVLAVLAHAEVVQGKTETPGFESKMKEFFHRTGEALGNSKAVVMLNEAQTKMNVNFKRVDQDMREIVSKMDEFFDGYSNKIKSSTEDMGAEFKKIRGDMQATMDGWKAGMMSKIYKD